MKVKTFFRNILFCDEAPITKNGIFIEHNDIIIRTLRTILTLFKSFSISVVDYLLRPVEWPVRLNAADYLHFLRNISPDLLEEVRLNNRQIIRFLHDGCLVHFSRNVANL